MSTAMNRLLWWHWLLIGFGAALVLFLILYFALIRPKQLDAQTAASEADGIETAGGTTDKVSAKKTELVKAQKDTVTINRSWAVESAVYMPPIEFPKDPLPTYEGNIQNSGVYVVNGHAYGVKDLPAVWGRWITYWYASQWRDGITPITGFPIESFSSDPNDVSKLQAISFPQTKPWDVEVVAKSFDAAMNHLKRFNSIQRHGMPVVDRVSMFGQSPDLHVKYNLQLFVIPPSAPPPADPKIGTAGGGGSAPSGFGGPMGGMMGSGGPMLGGGGKAMGGM
jgi:hypothetical protein